MTEPFVFSLDPGARTGLAAWSRGQLVHVAVVEIPLRRPGPVMVEALRSALDAMGNPEPRTARVVREGWTNPRGIPALKALHRIGEAWLDAAAEIGIDHTSEINSQTWQSQMGCTGESAERKRVSRAIAGDAMQRAGLPVPADPQDLDENIADAVCLGTWWHEEVRSAGAPRVMGRKRQRGSGSRWTAEDVAAVMGSS